MSHFMTVLSAMMTAAIAYLTCKFAVALATALWKSQRV